MSAIATVKRLLRFALVGGAATLLYGVLSVTLSRTVGATALQSHLLAYVLVIPLSFIGQKRITFGYKGDSGKAFARFVATSVLALLISTGVVWAFHATGFPSFYGTLATMMIVPVISYLMMAFWVFLDQAEA